MTLQLPFDTWKYTGAKTTYGTLAAVAAAAASPTTANDKDLAVLGSTAHGLLAGSLVHLEGTTNYNGLKNIQAVATNTITIYSAFTAETTATADLWKTMYVSQHPYLFLGFSVHLNAVSATSENLVISKDANAGSAFDIKLYSKDMNGIQDIHNIFDEPKPCVGGDKIDVVWDNTNAKTWGIELYTRRIG